MRDRKATCRGTSFVSEYCARSKRERTPVTDTRIVLCLACPAAETNNIVTIREMSG